MNQDTAHMTTMMDDLGVVDFAQNSEHENVGVEGGHSSEPHVESAVPYDEVFPALPDKETLLPDSGAANLGQWNQRMKMNQQMKMKSSSITQVFIVPMEERRFHDVNSFGEQAEQANICSHIMKETSATIEISSSKDQSLTIVIQGKEDAVKKARRELVAKLQTQATINLPIPKEHHRFILGKSGKTLKDLEFSTSTRITIPPRTEENKDVIVITGSKEGIDKARHEIQLISDEQAKLAFERLSIPRLFHPFINGPNGQTAAEITKETGARINIPPNSSMKDEITVAGEKEAVAKTVDKIMSIYEEKKRKCQPVSVEVKKKQHKYVYGPRGSTIQDILLKTGVSVEIPPSDSPSMTITLWGEQEKLGSAVTMLYAMANSGKDEYVEAPSCLHKHVIGRGGSNIKQFTQEYPKVHIEFTDGQDSIKVEGPVEEVDAAVKQLKEIVATLLEKFSFKEITVDPKFHRFIIGKNGSNVNRIKQELNVQIQIPPNSEVIRIVGSPNSVEEAKDQLLEMVNKMKNELSRDLIIEQQYHKAIIGTKGEKIREIRDRCNQVNVTFPEQGVKSDKVAIRGPKQDVDACYKELTKLYKEMVVNNYKEEVPIFKQLHKNIIGKKGSTIKKIREETDTKIDLPAEGSDSDVIIITGRKENVELARDKIQKIQNSLAHIVDDYLNIPFKIHNSIIGAKGHMIRAIKEECGGVVIHFPAEGSNSDKVIIRGPKDDVEKAKKQLLEVSNEKQLSGYEEEISAKREHHKFLIGKNGARIKKVRENTGARIVFPSEKDDDCNSIVIIGHKEAVLQAKKELQQMIADLDKMTEVTLQVDPKHHKHFVAQRGRVVQQIMEDNGGVTITFPRNGDTSWNVTIKGLKDCIQGAKDKVLEIVQDLESRVQIECIIPQEHHRIVLGAKGSRLQNITQVHNVNIKFPDRETREDEMNENGEATSPMTNGDAVLDLPEPEVEGEPRKRDIILISGQEKNCYAAKEALLALVPVTEEISIPYDLHRYIIGAKGKGVRDMMDEFDVSINVPKAESQSDLIQVKGPVANVEKAIAALKVKAQHLEDDKQDRALRSFEIRVEVPSKYHPKIIGKKGANVIKIRERFNVQIQFPRLDDDAEENVITIIGYEKKAEEARDEILSLVKEYESAHEVSVSIDPRVHSRLIGARGRSINRLMEEYEVDIKFPRSNSNDPSLVVVSGDEDRVEEAVDYLKNLEEEYLQDLSENTRHSHLQQDDDSDQRNNAKKAGFFVSGGPWEQRAPDTTSAEEFPSFGASDAPKSVAWGPRH